MLYGFLKKHIYWQVGKRAKFKAFHVTPYLNEILAQGELLPPSVTNKSVLGEDIGQRTIRGCLLSFFDEFQTAMNGCYTLALYAILDKNLLTDEEFESLVRSEISRHGISEDESLDGIPEDEIINMLLEFYQFGQTGALFNMLGRALEPFKNPVILTDGWVLNLPYDINGILNAIGVIEVDIDCKYIADPSTVSGGYSSPVYGYAESKGDFGLDLQGLDDLYDDTGYFDEDSESQAMAYESTQIAHYINRVCKSTSATLTDQNVKGELENTFGNLDEFKEESTRYGDSWVYGDVIAFVPEVTINPQDLAIWNPEEHEWRIPAPNGIKVDASNVVALAGDVALSVNEKPNKFETLVYKESEVRGRRKNPSQEWFETQRLQNDENGYLINPDTNDIYWFHGNRYGDCGHEWSDSGHRYLTSSFESARNFINEDPSTNNYRCVVCEYTVQIPASQIYDARKTQEGTIDPSRIEDLHYVNYDYNQETVYELGNYKGFLEVEAPSPPTAANLGIHLSHNHLLHVTREIEYCPNCVQAEVTDHGDFRECPKCSFRIGECDECSGWVEVGKSCPWCEGYGQRPNPSQEWFETQRLQNDENGYLINPDTGGTLWYHGSRYGGLLSGGRVIYFSSDMDIARTMACQFFTYAEDEGTTVIHKAKIKVRTDEIFDARYAESTDAARYLADRLELEGPYTTNSLDFDNFDEKIGYLAPEEADTSYAQALGFKGWLEVESTYGDPEPCTIGLFTNSSIDYEIVETLTLSMGDCKGFC